MLFKKIILGACFCFCFGYFCSPLLSFADTVVLKSGQIIEGKIIENTGKYVKIDFEGVELTYFQEEITSIKQGKADNAAASKGLSSLYEAFKSGKNIVRNKDLSTGLVAGSAQPMVNQKVQDTVNANSILLPQTAGGVDSLAAAQAVISQLPKEYREMFKSKIQNMQGSSNAGQAPGVAPADLSGLPPEYQHMIKSSLEQLQPNTQETKN